MGFVTREIRYNECLNIPKNSSTFKFLSQDTVGMTWGYKFVMSKIYEIICATHHAKHVGHEKPGKRQIYVFFKR